MEEINNNFNRGSLFITAFCIALIGIAIHTAGKLGQKVEQTRYEILRKPNKLEILKVKCKFNKCDTTVVDTEYYD